MTMNSMDEVPLIWVKNRHSTHQAEIAAVDRLLPAGITNEARAYHSQIPGYEMTPLKRLSNLSSRLGLGSIWVKDESAA